jgi:hypothetical protein
MVIVVFGGVQIDGADTKPSRFREDAVAEVARTVAAVLKDLHPRLVLGAAASGADLTVLRAARRIGLRRLVVLPFSVDRFRQTSVASRGQRWVDAYDRTLASLRADELEILDETEDDTVYQRTNTRLLDRAEQLAAGGDAGLAAGGDAGGAEEIALLVLRPAWGARGSVTDDLVAQAAGRGLEIVEVATNLDRRALADAPPARVAAGDRRAVRRAAALRA